MDRCLLLLLLATIAFESIASEESANGDACHPIYVHLSRAALDQTSRVSGPYDLNECQESCSKNRNPSNPRSSFPCAAFNHRRGYNSFTHDCQLYSEDQMLDLDHDLVARDQYSFYRKYCVNSKNRCRSAYEFDLVVDSYMDRFEIETSAKVQSVSECLRLCLDEQLFTCRSASYNRTGNICLLSPHNRLTLPGAIKVNNVPDYRIDYYENNCYNDSFSFATECKPDGILVSVEAQYPYTGAMYGLYDYFTCRYEPHSERNFSLFFPFPENSKNCSDSMYNQEGDIVVDVVVSTDGVQPLYFTTDQDLLYHARCKNPSSLEPAAATKPPKDKEFRKTSKSGILDLQSAEDALVHKQSTTRSTPLWWQTTDDTNESTSAIPSSSITSSSETSTTQADTTDVTTVLSSTTVTNTDTTTFTTDESTTTFSTSASTLEPVFENSLSTITNQNKADLTTTANENEAHVTRRRGSGARPTVLPALDSQPEVKEITEERAQTTIYTSTPTVVSTQKLTASLEYLSVRSRLNVVGSTLKSGSEIEFARLTTLSSTNLSTTAASPSTVTDTASSVHSTTPTASQKQGQHEGSSTPTLKSTPSTGLSSLGSNSLNVEESTVTSSVSSSTFSSFTKSTGSSSVTVPSTSNTSSRQNTNSNIINNSNIHTNNFWWKSDDDNRVPWWRKSTVGFPAAVEDSVDSEPPVVNEVSIVNPFFRTTTPTPGTLFSTLSTALGALGTTLGTTLTVLNDTTASSVKNTTNAELETTTAKTRQNAHVINASIDFSDDVNRQQSVSTTTKEPKRRRTSSTTAGTTVTAEDSETKNSSTTVSGTWSSEAATTPSVVPTSAPFDLNNLTKSVTPTESPSDIKFELLYNGIPTQAVLIQSLVTLSFTPGSNNLQIQPNQMALVGCKIEAVGSRYFLEPLILVEHGCPSDGVGLVYPVRRVKHGLAMEMEAFRFTDTSEVLYTCVVRTCDSTCSTFPCFDSNGNAYVSNGRRRKRQQFSPVFSETSPFKDFTVQKKLTVFNNQYDFQYYLRTGRVPANGQFSDELRLIG